MASYYKHDIPRWQKGTANLSDRAYRVYHVIIQQIMIAEGPILYHDKTLAGLANRSTRDLRSAVEELVAAGKIEIVDGMIHNDRCNREIEGLNSARKNISTGRRQGLARKAFDDHSPEKISPIGDEWSANGPRMVDEHNENFNENNESERVEVAIDKTRLDKTKKEKNKQKTEPALPLDLSAKKSKKQSAKQTADESFCKILSAVLGPEPIARVMELRKAKRLISTDEAAHDLIEQFAKFGDAESAVRLMARQGWGGFRHSWTDRMTPEEIGSLRPAPAPAKPQTIGWRDHVQTFRKSSGMDWRGQGPAPDEPGCRAPREILEEFGFFPKQPAPTLALVHSA